MRTIAPRLAEPWRQVRSAAGYAGAWAYGIAADRPCNRLGRGGGAPGGRRGGGMGVADILRPAIREQAVVEVARAEEQRGRAAVAPGGGGGGEPPRLAQRVLRWCGRYGWLLAVAAVAFYFCGFNGRWPFTPDSGKYLVVARHLAEGQGYTHPSGWQVRASPGLPWLEAASLRLTGGEVWPVLLVMTLLGLAGIGLAYRLFRMRLPREQAVAAAVLLGVSEVWYTASHRLLADMPFAVGAVLFLLAWERAAQRRGRTVATVAMFAVGLGVMAVFRSVVLTLLAGVAAAAVIHAARHRHFRPVVLGATGVAALLSLVVLVDPRVPEEGAFAGDEASAVRALVDRPGEVVHRAVTDHLPKLMTERMAEAVLGVDMNPVLSAVVATGVLGLGVVLFRERRVWGCIFFAFVGQWLLFGVTERYFLPVLPLLALAWWRVAVWVGSVVPRPWGGVAWAALVVVWLVPNAIRAGDVARDSLRTLGGRPAEEAAVFTLAEQMDARLPADAVVLTHRGKVADPMAFLSRRHCIVPGPRDVEALRPLMEASPSRLYVLLPTEGHVQSVLHRLRARFSGPLAEAAVEEGERAWTIHRLHPARVAGDEGAGEP